jgi:hypothetical protein
MSVRANRPSGQGSIARFADLKVVQFIGDALRAGERAILVTGRGQVSVRVPEAALACAGASALTLHIGPPLPEPAELQQMIGAAVGIGGGREMAPLAMAARLLFAEPRPNVVLAIDDAHTLSHRSLCYLTQMTDLLAPDAPVLQVVLAAGPVLLDTLAQPEFDSFRDRLVRQGFETLQTSPELKGDGASPDPPKPVHDRTAPHLTLVGKDPPMAASPGVRGPGVRGPGVRGIARPAAYAAAGLAFVVCLGAIGSIRFPALSIGPNPPPEPLPTGSIPSLLTTTTGDTSVRTFGDPPQQSENAERLVVPPSDSLSSAEPFDAAIALDREAVSVNAAAPVPLNAAADQDGDRAPPKILAVAAPTALAPSGERVGAGNENREAAPPDAGAPAFLRPVPDQDVGGSPPAIQASAAPTPPARPKEFGATSYEGRAADVKPAQSAGHPAASEHFPSRMHGRDGPRGRGGGQIGTVTLDAADLIRRFLQHVMPGGRHHIRHNRQFADASRTRNIVRAR